MKKFTIVWEVNGQQVSQDYTYQPSFGLSFDLFRLNVINCGHSHGCRCVSCPE